MKMTTPSISHLKRFRKTMAERDIDAALIVGRPGTHWLTGFRGSHSYTLVFPRSVEFITDSRYIELARKELRGITVTLQKTPVSDQIEHALRRHRIQRLGLEDDISHAEWKWARRLAPKGARVVDVSAMLRDLRAVKDAREIAAIRRAVSLTDEMFSDLIPWLRRRMRRVDVTEREIASWIKAEIDARGGEGPSFPPIVAAGSNSARPHAVPGNRKVRTGQFLLFDFGLILDGHCSDMTRTVLIGKGTARHRHIYETVLKAQRAALDSIRAGMRGAEIDAKARKIIGDAGHGPHFGHGLGHGVGVEIHEAPRLAPGVKTPLIAGNVVTVEPGIYMPGFGGVRIEDMVLVKSGGGEILTTSPKELICL